MEIHVAFCGGVRVRVHRADRVRRLYFVLQEADDRRHQVRRLRELRALLGDGQFWSSVGRVALFTCVQVPIMLFLSAAMALALDSMKLHGTRFFRISTFLPYAVPAVVST